MNVGTEAAGPKDGRVDQIKAIRGIHDDHSRRLLNTVKLGKQLIDYALGRHGTTTDYWPHAQSPCARHSHESEAHQDGP